MARADRRRDQRSARARPRPATDPATRYESAYAGTEGLFFQRIRRQAKWMFVLLALVFGVGFVAFGVGSDVQGGIADALGVGGGTTIGPKADDARERLEKNPRDAQALRDLATALQNEGKLDEAAEPLQRYTRLRPRDAEALRELAAIYLTRASKLRDELQQAQLEAQSLNPGAPFQPPASTPLGQAFATAPVVQAVSSSTNEQITKLYGDMQAAYGRAKNVYQRVARVEPGDASLQLQLADAAVNSGDTQTAIAAYRRFLKLAPEDPSAPLVKLEIQRLQRSGQVGAATG